VDAMASSVPQACVEVRRVLGPGFFESIYDLALTRRDNEPPSRDGSRTNRGPSLVNRSP